MSTLESYPADRRGRPTSVVRVTTSAGTAIYLMPVETFPGHVNNVYLVDHPEFPMLFDVGTTGGHEELVARFAEAREHGARAGLADVKLALVSHAHVDHYGNAGRIRELGIPIAIHELDARVLAAFSERFIVASRDIGLFLRHAGLSEPTVKSTLELYRMGKHLFHDLAPDRRLRNGDVVGPGWRVLHVPGHCPGMVCLAIDDVVLTADHLLARITPVQSPQSITPYMGLENYLRSLEKLRDFGPFTLALGAHEAPIPDMGVRIDETMEHHAARLRTIHGRCAERAMTVAEVSLSLFGAREGYGILLALLEAGAHVEWLHEHGHLRIENIDEVGGDAAAPARYMARPDGPEPERSRLAAS